MSRSHRTHYATNTPIGTLCNTVNGKAVLFINNVTYLRCLAIYADQQAEIEAADEQQADQEYTIAAETACREANILLSALQSGIIPNILQLKPSK